MSRYNIKTINTKVANVLGTLPEGSYLILVGVTLLLMSSWVSNSYPSLLSYSNSITLVVIICLGYALKDNPWAAFVLFLGTLPLYARGLFPFFPPLKLYHITFIFFIVTLYRSEYKERGKNRKNIWDYVKERLATPLDVPLLFFLGIAILSGFQSVYIPSNPPTLGNQVINTPWFNYPWLKSVSRLLLLLFCFLVYYACSYYLNTREKIMKYMRIQMMLAILFAIFGLSGIVLYVSSEYTLAPFGLPLHVSTSDEIPRLRGTEQEPLFFGYYLLLPAYVLLLSLFMNQNKTRASMLLIGGIITVLGAILFTGSRSVLLGFLGSLIVFISFFFVVTKGEKKMMQTNTFRKISVYVLLGVCLITLFSLASWKILIVNSELYPVIKEKVTINIISPIKGAFDPAYGKYWSTRTRLVTFRYALDAFKNHPFLGIGYENFIFHAGTKTYAGLLDFNMIWPEPNNYYLKVLAEMGALGFFAFLFFSCTIMLVLCGAWVKCKNRKDPTMQRYALAHLLFFCAFAIILLFSSTITKPYLWVTLAGAVAIVKNSQTTSTVSTIQ